MSRIGNQVINIPTGVEVTINDNNHVVVKGAKGTLEDTFNAEMNIELEDNQLRVKRPSDAKHHKQLHGTTRALLANMVNGVNEGYKIELSIIGLGYRAALQGKKLVLNVGYSHPVEFDVIEGINIEVPTQTEIVVSGIDKCLVGEFAANIRATRKPEPYKGKGIRYKNEIVKRKEGKKAGK
ncbi:MAG: 50S ribosomal protein L6 [Bacilli bacterium]|jgi:large subunit ribosomal protein L6|nr:50S ribosomal protein L6 [Bacilli bacterium]